MFPLDPKTVERVVKVICDLGGPFERKGYELERLVHHSGWPVEVEYDGTPRIQWLTDLLLDRADDTGAVERLLCRVSDPLEYDDGHDSADLVRVELNRMLKAEHLAVSYASGRPVVGLLGQEDSLLFTAPEQLETRLPALIDNTRAVDLLLDRVRETTVCEKNGAYVFAVIGIGSFIEGLLYNVLVERDAQIRDHGLPGQNGRRTPADRLALAQLIDVAHTKGWIQLDAKDFMHKVRDYRNYVHPRHQLERNLVPDKDTVMMCWGPARAVLNDLEVSLGG